jgi:hypothetical protein
MLDLHWDKVMVTKDLVDRLDCVARAIRRERGLIGGELPALGAGIEHRDDLLDGGGI